MGSIWLGRWGGIFMGGVGMGEETEDGGWAEGLR